jgi:hypothetical protein
VARKIENVLDGFNPIEICHQFLPELRQFRYIKSIEIKNPVLSKPTIFEKDGSKINKAAGAYEFTHRR